MFHWSNKCSNEKEILNSRLWQLNESLEQTQKKIKELDLEINSLKAENNIKEMKIQQLEKIYAKEIESHNKNINTEREKFKKAEQLEKQINNYEHKPRRQSNSRSIQAA